MSPKEFITIIVPALNEQDTIEGALISLMPSCPEYEILVMDGGSTDGTREVVERLSRENSRIRIILNEKRIQSAGVNKGVALAHPMSRYIVRADCHAWYPKGFVERLVEECRKNLACSVVVPMLTTGVTPVQRAIAATQNSRMGNGGALHRSNAGSRFVDHGHHAAFDRLAFERAGGYDESFTHNEDAELDIRLTDQGGRIWLCGDLRISYFPRRSFRLLAAQYFNHGSGRARTMVKHAKPPRLRQVLPLCVFVGNLAGLTGGILLSPVLAAPTLAYVFLCVAWGTKLSSERHDLACMLSGPAAITMHHAWALGFLHQVGRQLLGTAKAGFARFNPRLQ